MAVKIICVNGSIRDGSTADRALGFAIGALEKAGATCERFPIGGLPALDGRPDDQYPAAVGAWRAACAAADGLLITIPSYHGAMPGSLKNALDFVDEPQVAGMPFALIGVAGGDAEPPVTDTARVLRHIGGIAAVRDVVISRSGEHWGPGAEPANKEVAVAIEKVAESLVAVCNLRGQGTLPG